MPEQANTDEAHIKTLLERWADAVRRHDLLAALNAPAAHKLGPVRAAPTRIIRPGRRRTLRVLVRTSVPRQEGPNDNEESAKEQPSQVRRG